MMGTADGQSRKKDRGRPPHDRTHVYMRSRWGLPPPPDKSRIHASPVSEMH